jgi:hypothetical protein
MLQRRGINRLHMVNENQRLSALNPCECFDVPYAHLGSARELGMDRVFAEVSVLICRNCGQHWLRYFYEVEAFTGSGRWYLGAITPGQLSALSPENAKTMMEGLGWYFYGGSYFEGQSGKRLGELLMNP